MKKSGRKRKNRITELILVFALAAIWAVTAVIVLRTRGSTGDAEPPSAYPEYSGRVYTEINGNVPFFTDKDKSPECFKMFTEHDSLGRCGAAFACIGREMLPEEPRGRIGDIRPSGWHTVRYDDLIEDKYLYNRCHLIAYSLCGENANENNLITGTRYMNVEGMLPFETLVADYVRRTGNHVLYRVTPEFLGDNLLASGVLMEAYSVEDSGRGCSFCVYVYNIQPGIEIDYADGSSRVENKGENSK